MKRVFSESFSQFLSALQISDASVSEENQRHSQQKRASQKSVLFIYLAVKLQRETREPASGFTVYIYIYMHCCRICFVTALQL